ncbi:FtsQ-type POTRA domain-containing protein [uncultured Fibrobacter sp.]|uniref:cell division protein FtsQ/DivIB n=1 Tax=uncultured Fibrobacter sp. TaxID=261512 RepID=UPI002605336A|nr:FtsQ-type POTRA domain-containing protein [uncultured Fibrobacter sp.]
MRERKTTLLGRRIGTNERLRKQERARKVKHGFSCVFRWFKRGGWALGLILVVITVIAYQNRFYLQRFNPLELRHLQYVEIEGNRMLSWEDVMQSAQVETGMLMSELNADSVVTALKQLPLIRSVKVKKKFPSSLYIQLQESVPVLSVLENGKATVYSEKGVVFPLSMATAMRLPVLDSASIEKVELFADFLMTMRSKNSAMYERVSQLSWSEKDNAIKVVFRDAGYVVLFPPQKWENEVFVLCEAVEKGFVKDLHCAGELDMRFYGFAYIRNYDKRCVNG